MQKIPVTMLDNSKISCAKQCFRKFYYRYKLDWVRDGRKPAALAFGTAWHAAMDVIWGLYANNPAIPNDELVQTAMSAFKESWTEDGFPCEDSEPFGISLAELEPRTPYNAMEMLYAYVDQRRQLMDRCKLISIERPFIVPLSADLSTLYIGKLDKTVELEGGVSTVEHKTTSLYSKASKIRPSFLDSFSPNSQIDGYTHAGKMLHGEKFKSVLVDVALVHKHVHDGFAIVPCRKLSHAMDEFLRDTTFWISQIKWCEAEGYWPKNTNSCFDYNQVCPYADLCKGRNFDQMLETYEGYNGTDTYPEPLPGFKVEVWDPVEELHVNLDALDEYMLTEEK